LDTLEYHQATKHTPASVHYSRYRLNWAISPSPFKQYLDLDPLALPEPAPPTEYPATDAIAERRADARPLDAKELSRILSLAAGVSRVWEGPVAPLFFRTYASAGALYPIEVYLACGGIDGLPPGLYHFHPLEGALRKLREGDPRPYLVRATGERQTTAQAPLSVILSGIPWRTSWKYRSRGYRHLFWDAGMILANLLALNGSGGHRAEVVLGFADSEINQLLGVDGAREMAICIVPIGFGSGAGGRAAPPATGPPESISHAVAPLSDAEITYPDIVAAHESSNLGSPDEAREVQQPSSAPGSSARITELCPNEGLERVILRRGSKRVFHRSAIPVERLDGIISHATHQLSCDWGPQLTQVVLIANAAEGLESGSYGYSGGLELMKPGDFRKQAQFLCLEQPLGGDSAATLFLMADLEHAFDTMGNRGYRAAQLDAGIVAGRLYLASYACRFGATGLTFYDDEVRRFFDTEAEPMMVVAIGR
jgi:SagB-type dehydrogenase family enzyme